MKLIIAVFLCCSSVAFAEAPPCGGMLEKRAVLGLEPTASALYEELRDIESGAWKDGFWEETFTYVGDLNTSSGTVFRIGFLTTTWRQACRATHDVQVRPGTRGRGGFWEAR